MDVQKQRREEITVTFEQNLWGYAAELCKKYLQEHASEGTVWYEYGVSLAELSRYDEARHAFAQALKYSHEIIHVLIFTGLGRLDERRGNYQEAETWYVKAIEAEPEATWHRILLGVMTFRSGNLQRAEQIYRDAIEIGGEEQDEAYFNLGGVLVAQERYEEAQRCYEEALNLEPEYKLAQLRLHDVNQILKMTNSKKV